MDELFCPFCFITLAVGEKTTLKVGRHHNVSKSLLVIIHCALCILRFLFYILHELAKRVRLLFRVFFFTGFWALAVEEAVSGPIVMYTKNVLRQSSNVWLKSDKSQIKLLNYWAKHRLCLIYRYFVIINTCIMVSSSPSFGFGVWALRALLRIWSICEL